MDAVQYLVRVRCDTYNQSAYIKDALDGFCMQKTNFPYVCTIFDDASTDGEQDVIRNYLQEHFELDDSSVVRNEETDDYLLTFSRHKENRNCYFAVYFLKYNHYSIKKSRLPYSEEFNNCSKYIATCEGDDFWTDQYKLQRQFDVMEAHADCTICFCIIKKISKDGMYLGTTFPLKNHLKAGVVTIDGFLDEEFSNDIWCFHTSSFFFRSELNKISGRNDFFNHFHVGDLPTVLWALLHGDGFFIDEIGGCYRVFSGGFTTYRVLHKDWAVKNLEKWLSAYSYFDKFTNYKYHKHVSRKIGFKLLDKYFSQDMPLRMLNIKFWWQYYKKPSFLAKSFLKLLLPDTIVSFLRGKWYGYKFNSNIKDLSADSNFKS